MNLAFSLHSPFTDERNKLVLLGGAGAAGQAQALEQDVPNGRGKVGVAHMLLRRCLTSSTTISAAPGAEFGSATCSWKSAPQSSKACWASGHQRHGGPRSGARRDGARSSQRDPIPLPCEPLALQRGPSCAGTLQPRSLGRHLTERD